MDRSRTLTTTTRTSEVPVGVDDVWPVVAGTAGSPWYLDAAPFVFRGGLDRLVGGRGRRWPVPDHDELADGDRAGFWTAVEAVAPQRAPGRLVLEAQVRAPGTVVLTTEVASRGPRRSRVRQTVGFQPAGVLGVAYLLADLGAREAVMELTHRRLLHDVEASIRRSCPS